MVREFKLPDVGEGLTEAEIVTWLVSVGDPVSEDQPVAEVETDKAVVEVPAPVNGTVKEILAEEGEMVPVGDVIITFDVEGEATEAQAAEAEAEEVAEAEAEEAAEAEGEADTSATGGRIFAAPSARRLSRELGVDIASVSGSGPGGRVTDGDVRAAAEGGEEEEEEEVVSVTHEVTEEAEPEPVAAPAEPMAAAERDRTLAAPATRQLAVEKGVDLNTVPTDLEEDGQPFVTPEQVTQYANGQRAAQAADAQQLARRAPAGGEERVPYKGIRRTIGKQMERSKYTAPHVTHHDEIDVTHLVEVRANLKEEAAEQGVKLSYMPFVMKAIVAGLRKHPVLNSMLDEENEEIVIKHDYNIGIAAATEAGLMVPVVKDVGNRGMLDIAQEMNDLIEKARERSIAREDMQGGTFTITNFGAIGGEYATPIINYPETAILGLGAIKEKPRVVDGEIVPRKVMTISLSIDHRVIDGADAAQFANVVKQYLENPELLLLE
jgi:pyruvate dehydrogenase E2 component (dihydrolipoamide acetyltransferase)